MPVLRPLPPRPSLEFDRKEAKALLRQLRAGDAEALRRAQALHPAFSHDQPRAPMALADAQLIVAREYGFASWPRLVQYHEGVERLRFASPQLMPPEYFDRQVRALLAQHRERRGFAARQLAAFVPRFYGMQVTEVHDQHVTEDEARLAIARSSRAPSWDVLMELSAQRPQTHADQWNVLPAQRAVRAILRADVTALQAAVASDPAILGQRQSDHGDYDLMYHVLDAERRHGREALHPLVAWLESRGLNLQRALNERLRGLMQSSADTVRELLDRGADASWIASSGISMLEHALLRFWNGEAADAVAARTTPPRALWVAAGLGDVQQMRRYFDVNGKLTDAARRHRPPFDVVAPFILYSLPDPDDHERLMEVFWVALLNQRVDAMRFLVARGVDVNSLHWGATAATWAAAYGWSEVLAFLIDAGANLDTRGWLTSSTARELAREQWLNGRSGTSNRRVVELCGFDPDALLAERAAEVRPAASLSPRLTEAIALASDDAMRHGQDDVREINLLYGLLRHGQLPLLYIMQSGEVDRDQFKSEVMPRAANTDRVSDAALPLHHEASALLDEATRLATERRQTVSVLHMLAALVARDDGITAQLISRCGGDVPQLRRALDRSM